MTQTVVIKHERSRRPLPLPLAIVAGILRGVWMLVGQLLLPAGFWVLRETLIGRVRRAALPVWVGILAAVQVRDITWAWLTAALTFTVIGWVVDRTGRTRVLSGREWWLWQRGTCLITLWHLLTPGAPWWIAYPALAAVVLGVAIPWWAGGRAAGLVIHRETPQESAWRQQVSDHPNVNPDLRESRLVVDRAQSSPDVTTGVVHLKPGIRASTVTALDEHVESLLDLPRGTLALGTSPGMSPRQVRAVFSRHGTSDVVRWFEGPSLDGTGAYVVGRPTDGSLVHDRIWHETGGSFATVLSGPRLGKGVRMRLDAIEGGLSEHVWQAAIDGKSGAGFPEIAQACDLYVGPEGVAAWRLVIAAVYAIYRERAVRYGRAGRSLFRPRRLDPVISLLVDESLRVMTEVGPRHIQMIEDMSGGGSSLGIRLVLDAQKGDAKSMGTTTIRSNLRANGSVWIGPTGDHQARVAAVQDWDGLDPAALPAAKGWAWQASRPQALMPTQIRTLYLPSLIEVEELGTEAPFGVAEDWAARAVHPELHPGDQAVLDAVLDPEDAQDGAPRLRVVGPSAPQAPGGRDRIRKVLGEATGPLERGEIARLAKVGARHTSTLLSELEAAGEARRTDQGWVRAA